MRLLQWRSDENLVRWLEELTKTSQFNAMMQMLSDEHPKNYQATGDNADRQLGKIYGYDNAINNLLAASVPVVDQTPIQATFEKQ